MERADITNGQKNGLAVTFDNPDLRVPPEGLSSMAELFMLRTRKSADSDSFFAKHHGLWKPTTWLEYGERAELFGHALLDLGLSKGDVVSVMSLNNPEWVISDMGTLGAGCVCSGVYPTDSPSQVEYLVNDSRTRVIVVEDDEQLDKVLAVRGNCPSLLQIVVIDQSKLPDFEDAMVSGFGEFLERGKSHRERNPGAWIAAHADLGHADPAIVVYTSGTTGPAKGAVLTHGNLLYTCYASRPVFERDAGDPVLSFLPLCHIAERVTGSYLQILCGSVIFFAESMETVPDNLKEIQPRWVFAVPRIWEKLHSGVNVALREGVPLQRLAYRIAMKAADSVYQTRLAGRAPNFFQRACFFLADLLVLKNLKTMLGLGRAHSILTGAAPISPELIGWYRKLGIDVQEAYGQTEATCFLTVTEKGSLKTGNVGKPLEGYEVKLGPDNEIMARGPNIFTGYLNKPEQTESSLEDGWLHTGDVGEMTPDGSLRIVDRLKDIIITAGGKNVTPSEIENELKFSPYISDAIIVGDRRPFLTCLLLIDHENVVKYAQENNVPFSNFASLTQAREVRDLIGSEIDAVNRKFARVEQIKKFSLIDRLLTPEDDELTPTLKLKRKMVEKKFSGEIEAMYG